MEKTNVEEAYATKTQLKLELKVMKEAYTSMLNDVIEDFYKEHKMSHLISCIDIKRDYDSFDAYVRAKTGNDYHEYVNIEVMMNFGEPFEHDIEITATSEVHRNDEDMPKYYNIRQLYGATLIDMESLVKKIDSIPWKEYAECVANLKEAENVIEAYERSHGRKRLNKQKKIVKNLIKTNDKLYYYRHFCGDTERLLVDRIDGRYVILKTRNGYSQRMTLKDIVESIINDGDYFLTGNNRKIVLEL